MWGKSITKWKRQAYAETPTTKPHRPPNQTMEQLSNLWLVTLCHCDIVTLYSESAWLLSRPPCDTVTKSATRWQHWPRSCLIQLGQPCHIGYRWINLEMRKQRTKSSAFHVGLWQLLLQATPVASCGNVQRFSTAVAMFLQHLSYDPTYDMTHDSDSQ